MDEDISQVTILTVDLEEIKAVLASSYYQNTCLDMVDMYRKLSKRQSYSPMTKAIQAAIGKIDNYLALSIEDEEDEPK